MIRHADILAWGWAGNEYTLNGPDFGSDAAAFAAALTWAETNPASRPTLADLEARRADADAAFATAAKHAKWRDELTSREDRLLLLLEVFGAALADLQARVPGVPNGLKNAVATANTRLAQIRALT